MTYYEVALKLKFANDKPVTEYYLVDAMSVTEAEAKVIADAKAEDPNADVEVKAVKRSRIIKVI